MSTRSNDPEQLARELEQMHAALREKEELLGEKDERIAYLLKQVEIFKKIAFGRGSEKRSPEPTDPRQKGLFDAILAEAREVARREAVEGELIEEKPAQPKKKAKRRGKWPEHVPHFKTTYELPESERDCSACGSALGEIGEAVTKELERIETTIVHEIARKKYACRSCGGSAKTAPGPARVIEGGLLGPGFLAHVITERFLNHMPYHRQEQKYGSEGLDLSRTVLERSAARCAEILKPIHDELGRQVFSKDVLFTDDTPVTVAKSSKGGSREGRIWTYADKDGAHYYDSTESRKRDGPARLLGDYRGFIHADAYPGYDPLFLPGGATEVGCWAHARRKFVDAEKQEPELAKEAIDQIRRLYAVEREATEAGLDDDGRRELRRKNSRPILERFEKWLDAAEAKALPKGALADALRYARNQWRALCVFVEDGRLEIDNNRAERSLRPFAVGRKNWLFFQTPAGGVTAAILMSLVRSARDIGLDPRVYLRDVLVRIAHESDVTKLVPSGWKQHFAEQVEADYRGSVRVILGPPADAP